MPEFFTLMAPDDARAVWFEACPPHPQPQPIPTGQALGRVTTAATRSPEALPAFRRSTVDGYAVRAKDTHGASDSLPAYLRTAGEVPMGQVPAIDMPSGAAVLVHTGGAIPESADAVVMVEYTQQAGQDEIEVVRTVAAGENVIQVGEDIEPGAEVLPAGHTVRPQDIGGLLALGITEIQVARQPVVAIISTGDEVVTPDSPVRPGQVRDTNSYTVGALAAQAGGEPLLAGIIPDNFDALRAAADDALQRADMVVISAGSSVSYRDLTANVIDDLGEPGVLVHGVAIKPGKPTILAAVDGKPVMGLPGNPVSAINIFRLLGVPMVRRLLGTGEPPRHTVTARLAGNVASAAGREDYVSVQLRPAGDGGRPWAAPIFGKSNLIYTLVHADGLVKVPMDTTGLRQGETVEVTLF
jgi:molybdopterin molybdotransferase